MSTELATLEAKEVADFSVFSNQDLELAELLEENLGDEEFRPSDLTRIKVPGGGGTIFEVPTASGPAEVKELEAIILKVTPARFFWKTSFEEGGGEGTPPDCYSDDLIHGYGNPGGFCADCPMNKFPEDSKKGKPCTEKRNIFILPANSLLPYNLSCPVKSIANLKQYRIELTRQGLTLPMITTLVSLKKEKNASGISYSQLVFRPGRPLAQEQAAIVRQYKASFTGVLEQAKGNGNGNGQAAPAPDFAAM